MIVRADDGGLGNLTCEAFRHLRPERAVIVLNGEVDKLDRYTNDWGCELRAVDIHESRWPLALVNWLLDADVLWSAETFYDKTLVSRCALKEVLPVLYAMPELFDPGLRRDVTRGRLRVVAPTTWELERLGSASVLPLPVNTERLGARQRERVESILHVSASAMLDRNGTTAFKQALALVRTPLEVFVSGPKRPQQRAKVGVCDVVPLPHLDDYWSVYDFGDALVIPRRYGGLSMPMREGMATGMPLVALDRAPEHDWTPLTTATRNHVLHQMKGGDVEVVQGDPVSLAKCIEALAGGDVDVPALSAASLCLRETDSWEALLPAWRDSVTR
jgi:hypothetical protein